MSKPEYVLNEGGQEKGISRLHVQRRRKIANISALRKKETLRRLKRERDRHDPNNLKGKTNRKRRKGLKNRGEEVLVISKNQPEVWEVYEFDDNAPRKTKTEYEPNWLEEIEDPDFID